MFLIHIFSKPMSDLKQNCTQLLAQFSDKVFNGLSLGVIHFARSVSFENKLNRSLWLAVTDFPPVSKWCLGTHGLWNLFYKITWLLFELKVNCSRVAAAVSSSTQSKAERITQPFKQDQKGNKTLPFKESMCVSGANTLTKRITPCERA